MTLMPNISIRKRIDEESFQKALQNSKLNLELALAKKPEKKYCEVCKKEIFGRPTKRFCSTNCRLIAWRALGSKLKGFDNCLNCSAELKDKSKRFCTLKCSVNYIEQKSNFGGKSMLTITCDFCKKEHKFERERGKKRRFCSNKCAKDFHNGQRKPRTVKTVEVINIEEVKEVKQEPKRIVPLLKEEEFKEGQELKLFNVHDDDVDRKVKLTFPEIAKDYNNLGTRALRYFRGAIVARHASFVEWKTFIGGTRDKYNLFTELWKSGPAAILRNWRSN